jgi:hypothetical protein
MMDVHHLEFPRRRRAQLGMSEKILANSRELENLIDGTDTPTVSPRNGSHDKFPRSPLLSTIYRKVLRSALHTNKIYSTLAMVDAQCG